MQLRHVKRGCTISPTDAPAMARSGHALRRALTAAAFSRVGTAAAVATRARVAGSRVVGSYLRPLRLPHHTRTTPAARKYSGNARFSARHKKPLRARKMCCTSWSTTCDHRSAHTARRRCTARTFSSSPIQEPLFCEHSAKRRSAPPAGEQQPPHPLPLSLPSLALLNHG